MQKQRLRDAQMQTIAVFYAVGTAFGSLKIERFREFLDTLGMKKKDVHKVIDEMKSKGLNIEEG